MKRFESFIPRLEELLQQVGNYLCTAQGTVASQRKGVDDVVSDADRIAQLFLLEGLQAIMPEALFRGEEAVWEPWAADRYCWLVDPLDGTKPYLRGDDKWGISVALIHEGSPVLGAVHVPKGAGFSYAIKGRGAQNGTQPLRVNPDAPDSVVSDYGYAFLERLGDEELLKSARKVGFATAVVEPMQVALGTAGAFIGNPSRYRNEWDMAAVSLIVEEAGGRVTDFNGNTVTYGKAEPLVPEILLSNGVAHDDLLARLRQDYK